MSRMDGLVEVPSNGMSSGAAVWENKRPKGSWTVTSSVWAQVRTFLTATQPDVTWTTLDDGSLVRRPALYGNIS